MAEGLKLYNTLTRSKVDFIPIDPKNVRMYVCGPTVYDFAHIGNARPVIVFDVLYRLLRHIYGENHVTYARNITDVDDKINARALRDFPDLPLNEAIAKVTQKTADQFHADVARLGCLAPTVEPRATDNIEQMIVIVQKLLDGGFAYIAQGRDGREALFDVLRMPNYGALSKRNLTDQQAGARIAVEPHKRNPEDFVLWKESAATEPGWPASFTISEENRAELRVNQNTVSIYGRPGWHIECSAMSKRYLGEVFDIHGGGLDLIFPHHENEIAQSCCANDTSVMANVWMHNGFVQVEGKKMSKSEGNFVTINELLDTKKFGNRKWPGEVLRLAMLMTHYRQPIDFSISRLEEAVRILKRWNLIAEAYDPNIKASVDSEALHLFSDDLDTPAVVTRLHALVKNEDFPETLAATLKFLGLWWPSKEWKKYDHQADDTLSAAIDALVEMRLEMLKTKNFAEADKIRDDLLAKGIQLKDGKDKDTGERVTTWEVKR
ncbi:cysteine--tRNA ligase [Agrobacterium vitis]|uniref:cysteine--tRNA ligase n=1 Tax=Agrobacterium vitis TaxID=373 RepID=UPI0012E7A069|nr:cysteine--tRNA ligase [Agrobacterium vitis]MVA62378.1 cysteine--tRNA ligase [Agrobacterium vitis]